MVVFAVGLMAFPPVMQAHMMDSFPTDSMGGDLGAIRTTYIGIGALGPTLVGVTVDVLDFTAAFTGFAGCLVVSGLPAGVVGRR